MAIRILGRAGTVAAVLAIACFVAWLADALGSGLPPPVARALVLAAAGAAAVVLARTAARLWRAGGPGDRAGRILLAMVALSLAIKLMGIDFELIDHPRNDEGVYHRVSRQINAGELVPETFNYGHLLYYSGAWVLWLRDLFPEAVPAVAQAVWGEVEGEYALRHLLLRALTAGVAALTVIPIFWVGRRVARGLPGDPHGTRAATLGALLIAVSPIYQQVAQLLLSDVLAGFFAALTFGACARLLDGESTRGYLFAGVAAGLAAASKYPGGVAAVAIIGLWVYWRLRSRRMSWGLLWAGLASIAAFVGAMPGLVLRFDQAFASSGYSVFFGFHQYAFGGWIGVVPDSVAAWTAGTTIWNFGWPAVLAGVVGLLWLRGEPLKRLAGMAPFPLADLLLLGSMSMVVQRNLQPVLPALAAILGIGLAAWAGPLAALGRRLPRALGAALPALVAVAALALPAWRTLNWNVSHLRPGTRELARTWIETNVPEGAAILTETQAPRLDESRYLVHHRRFAALDSLDDIRDPLWDYLILARPAYGLFLDPSNWREPHHEEMARRYREMLDFEQAAEFVPGPWRSGPRLQILEVDPEQPVYRTRRVFAAADAVWLSTPDLKRDGPNGSIRFRRRWHYAAFKDHFAAGRYRVAWGSRPNPPLGGWLYVVGRDGREVGTFEIVPELTLELPSPGKYFLRVFLPPRSMLHGLELERVEPAG